MGLDLFTRMLVNQAQAPTPPPPDPDPEPRSFNLLVSEEAVEFSGAQSWFSNASGTTTERLFTPRMLWWESKGMTIDMYQRAQKDYYGQLGAIVFDKVRGFDVPFTVGPFMGLSPINTPDTHTVGSMTISLDPDDDIEKIYASQEHTHLVPFNVYEGLNGDYSRFSTVFQIGLNLAYANYLKGPTGHDLIWCRGGELSGDANHLYSVFVVESTNYFKGLDTATPRRISERPEIGLWHYPGVPWGHYKDNTGRYYLLITLRTGQADGGTYTNEANSAFYLVTTTDFITFSNYLQTFSHNTSTDGLLTDAILQANFMYHQTNAVDIQGRSPVVGISATGFFAAIVGHPANNGTYRFKYYDEEGVLQDKNISIPNMWVAPTDNQTGPFGYMMIFENEIICKCDIDDGTYVRPHWIRSTDLGDNWTDLGDIAPEHPNQDLWLRIPNNIMEIPEDEPFAIHLVGPDSSNRQKVFCKVAIWGSSIPAIPGASITPATEMNYNSTGLFHYKCTDGNLTRSGNNVTAFIDLFGLRNATAVNNPQWNGSDSVAFTSASSQQLQYSSTAALLSLTAFTYCIVGKFTAAFTAIAFSNNTDTDRFVEVRIQSDGIVAVRVINNTASSAAVTSQDTVNDGEFHVIWIEQDGEQSTKIFIDGKQQYFATTLTGSSTIWGNIGKGPAFVTGANAVRTNVIDISGTDAFTNGVVAEKIGYSGIMPLTESRSRMYKLCQDYGVTYQNQFRLPA